MADQLGKDGGAGGSCKFSGNIDLANWDSSQDLCSGGGGKGKGAMRTLDCACAFDRNGGGDVGKA